MWDAIEHRDDVKERKNKITLTTIYRAILEVYNFILPKNHTLEPIMLKLLQVYTILCYPATLTLIAGIMYNCDTHILGSIKICGFIFHQS